jgi:hypothetical protein
MIAMSRLVSRSLLAGLAALAASTTFASAFDEIDRRQAMQQQRIQQGVRNGDLTGREYRALQAEQARIADLERRAKADGRVDRFEAERIRQAQQAASRHIYQERHDREQRGSWGSWGFRRWW